ncbi:MAG: DUF6094 domain-containing protein [Gammaproteobacteria bacterium]|uniref:DUF6094 domain-containing protein n=1 Tax=uncultured Pseudacidovorax sp. TaxID=679313 RepID=UPI0025E790B4|nr:DUF6094 domain-containing protein [uncultured Pseudacidovorax sp.]
MALMFARNARNFIKNGYFPTDEATLEGIIAMLRPGPGPCRLLDPCCGEGSALADVRHGLHQHSAAQEAPAIEALGIEFDRERAWHAKQCLDRVIHADMHDVIVKPRSIGLMFLNPPYGYGVSDNANRSAADAEAGKAERLERTFLRKCTPYIAYGGIMVYIVPHYALDDEIRAHLARNYDDVRVFMAPERRFRQCVVIGRRRKAGNATRAVQELLARAQASEDQAPGLSTDFVDAPYVIPAAEEADCDFHAVRIDADQLAHELDRYRSALLWEGLENHFRQTAGACRPPLRELTPWHLALSLAAGQVSGRFRSADGREFLLKGDTFKQKQRTVVTEFNDKGEASQVITLLDRFVPVINAIEFTPDHRLGQIVKIA